ncbi:hypothetical protein NLJ89_g7295 [Agrocybe chaxingu]|uniref:Uncharacterized protein n=1 Tax=Agrocybe chaxingu TaxID=84603 RepID=A0A9W8JWZ2_9AGAR|nr:hypothetical protein NLJ89_g7295 [Agrocybe chaxingu]
MWTDQTFILPTSKLMSHAFKYQQSLPYSTMVRDLLEDASPSRDYLKLDFDPRIPITPYAPALEPLFHLTHLAIELIPMKDPISLTPFVEMLKLSCPLFASELLPTLFSSKSLKANLSAQIGQAW